MGTKPPISSTNLDSKPPSRVHNKHDKVHRIQRPCTPTRSAAVLPYCIFIALWSINKHLRGHTDSRQILDRLPLINPVLASGWRVTLISGHRQDSLHHSSAYEGQAFVRPSSHQHPLLPICLASSTRTVPDTPSNEALRCTNQPSDPDPPFERSAAPKPPWSFGLGRCLRVTRHHSSQNPQEKGG